METRPNDIDVLLNVGGFLAAWLALFYFAANGPGGLGLVLALAIIALHVWQSPDGLAEVRLIGIATAIGAVAEALIIHLDLISYSGVSLVGGLPPLWVLAQWAVFATLLNVTLRPLRSWVLLSLGLGFVFLPLAKLVGLKFGVADMPAPAYRSVALIGLCWSVTLVALFAAARFWDGWREL